MYTLTFLDTVSVQNYIFNSNELIHIVGASGLVHQATHDWVFQMLASFGETNVDERGTVDPARRIEDGGLVSELLYAGGGNAVLLFREHDTALRFANKLSGHVLSNAPGLDLVISHVEFDWDSELERGQLRWKVREVMKQANRKKQNRPRSVPLMGLGVTVSCPYTGKPAVARNREGVRISNEVRAKIAAFSNADQRLRAEFGDLNGREYLYNFNQIKGEEKGSYIAVIHSDGTGMGDRVTAITRKPENSDNRAYITDIRRFSDSIKTASRNAMKDIIVRLLQAVADGQIDLVENHLPFRPIIFGGDDVTFVCDGMLGLSLAEYHLERTAAYLLSDGHPIFARSGVAVVKSHFPFSQAYIMAESLNHSARAYAKELQNNGDVPPFTLDWHFSSSGPVLDLARIRHQKYTLQEPGVQGNGRSNLLMRPLVVGQAGAGNWRSWEVFESILTAFLYGSVYTQKHSKLKRLAAVVFEKREAVRQFLIRNRMELPAIDGYPTASTEGWIGNQCAYFDALEAMDFFIPLRGRQDE